MNYDNAFILQNETAFFFDKLAKFLASNKMMDYSFEMVYSSEKKYHQMNLMIFSCQNIMES
ncbi:hypothetical protein PS9952019_17925 [Providencia stuartii]|nr:hypothetical protein PS9952019_17925 [Providencia stuartii]